MSGCRRSAVVRQLQTKIPLGVVTGEVYGGEGVGERGVGNMAQQVK